MVVGMVIQTVLVLFHSDDWSKVKEHKSDWLVALAKCLTVTA